MTYLHTRSQNIKWNGGGDKYDLIVLLVLNCLNISSKWKETQLSRYIVIDKRFTYGNISYGGKDSFN